MIVHHSEECVLTRGLHDKLLARRILFRKEDKSMENQKEEQVLRYKGTK
jgi:hypothetical protein